MQLLDHALAHRRALDNDFREKLDDKMHDTNLGGVERKIAAGNYSGPGGDGLWAAAAQKCGYLKVSESNFQFDSDTFLHPRPVAAPSLHQICALRTKMKQTRHSQLPPFFAKLPLLRAAV